MRSAVLAVLSALCLAQPALAQRQISADQKAALLQQEWTRLARQVAASRGLTIGDDRLRPADASARDFTAAVVEAYVEIVNLLVTDPRLEPFFRPDPSLISEVTPQEDEAWIARLKDSGLDGKGAKSLNAGAMNPAGSRGVEHSGFSDLIALATDFKDVVASDSSAISLNLNALALIGLKDDGVYSAPERYRRYDTLRRFGGTVTFGGKVPESEITGFSGLPTASRLLDVFVWDTKVRLYGDRDPRAGRWYNEMLGTMGGLTEIAASLPALAPARDRALVAQIVSERLGLALTRVKTRVANSMQIALKVAGQQLTKETGRSKYGLGALVDKGFGDTDLTFNLLYSTTDRLDIGTGASPFRADDVTTAVGVSSLIAKDAIVKGRAASLGVDVAFDVPVHKEGPRQSLDTRWWLVGTVSLPFGNSALIPVSITYASDPNSLEKQKYIVGHIGVTYDFGSLKNLFN